MQTEVLIIGAGFAGLNAAKVLAHRRLDSLHVTILDRSNHHLFQPLLYQVAMAGLGANEIAAPIRSIVGGFRNVDVLMTEVLEICPHARTVRTREGERRYDFLIVACGSTHSYFGHSEWENAAPGLKTIEQALEIRRRVLLAFEQAEIEPDADRRRELLTFVVVGGGPTGVELAGSLAEISRHTLASDFHRIDSSQARVILIEGGPRLLAQMSEVSSKRAARALERLGVTIWTHSRVTEIRSGQVQVGGESLRAQTVLWAAGVKPSPLGQFLGVPLDAVGRVKVQSDCSVPGHPEIFVIGDMAHFTTTSGEVLPGVAPVAIQQGRYVAKTILGQSRNRAPFVYRDKGMLATIGRASAVGEMGRWRFSGLVAWLMWLIVHIYYLIGFQNRILVLFQWAWGYFTYKRGARLIVNCDWKSDKLL